MPASVAAMTLLHSLKARRKAAVCRVAVPLPFGDEGSRKGVTRLRPGNAREPAADPSRNGLAATRHRPLRR